MTTPEEHVTFAAEQPAEHIVRFASGETLTKQEASAFDIFFTEFKEIFSEPVALEYATALVHNAVYPTSRIALTREELSEMGIKVGHRKQLIAMLARLRRPQLDPSNVNFSPTDGLPGQVSDEVSKLFSEVAHYPGPCSRRVWQLDGNQTWRDWSGLRKSIEEFERGMKDEVTPIDPSLMRFFRNDKPLPFSLSGVNKSGAPFSGVLLRIPRSDFVSEQGVLDVRVGDTTIHKLMNRFVIIHVAGKEDKDPSFLVTYYKEHHPDFIQTQSNAWSDLRSRGIDAVLDQVIRDALETFRPVLNALQLQAEFCASLPDSYRANEVVRAFSRIQRQASAVERSLRGNTKVLEELKDSSTITEDLSGAISLSKDLQEIAEEVQSNASEMMSLRLTMLDFKTQNNMKLFTYFSVTVAPVGVITGWFSMGFAEQADRVYSLSGLYYAVIVFVVLIILSTAFFLYWSNRDPHRLGEHDAEDAKLVLRSFDPVKN